VAWRHRYRNSLLLATGDLSYLEAALDEGIGALRGS
jgi:hypothetical protein